MSLPRLADGGVVVVACDNKQIRKVFEIAGADRRVAVERSVEPALDHTDRLLPAAWRLCGATARIASWTS
jgi:hypothetical protein